MNRSITLATLLAATMLSGCTLAPPVTPIPPAAAAPAEPQLAAEPQTSARDRLFALFEASDEDQLRRNPLFAIFRGDTRFADRFGDFITDEYIAGERAAAEAELAALRAIDRNALSAVDRIAYDTFEFQTRQTLKGLTPEIVQLTAVRPLNHFFGFHTFYPTFASGKGAAPFKTVEDYDNNLKRHREFATYLDRAIERFRQGQQTGVVETRLTIRNVVEQLDTQLKQGIEESPYFGPTQDYPDDFSEADKARLTQAYRASVSQDLYPALGRLRDFLRDEYMASAREGVGLMYMAGGDQLYLQMIESTTTLPMQPEEIHQLGLSEVARIRSEMDKVRREVGFRGTLGQFFGHLRTAPQFKPKSREALTQGYYAIGRKVDAHLPRYFSTIPKAGLEIRPYEEFREKFEAGGSYEQGTPDGSRPGVFYFNAYDLPSRTTPGMTTLYLHEGAPGHHFQISLAQENEALPAFMRFGGNTAYVEGWALYAETLGYEMGLFDDPYQRFGTLSDEMLRAMRLVVDTGLHAKGWTRNQAISYMMANSDMGRTDATAEVERYIAIPSQALAYKIGALTIQRLRAKAEAELGDRFDIRDFHAQVLMTGALPMPVLEKKIHDWIAEKKAA